MVHDAVAAGCPTDSTGLWFFWSVSAYNTDVGRLATFWELGRADEVQSIGASRHFGVGTKTLEHTANFFRVGVVPQGAIAALTELLIAGNGFRIGVNGRTVHCPVFTILDEGMGDGSVGFADTGCSVLFFVGAPVGTGFG
jgi:hypothetical protein